MHKKIIRLFVFQVGREGEIQPLTIRPLPVNQFSIVHERELLPHDPYAFMKCCESLAFLVRDVAHITPYNFENCVHCIRMFVEASLNGSKFHIVAKIITVVHHVSYFVPHSLTDCMNLIRIGEVMSIHPSIHPSTLKLLKRFQ
jgi:hypothetical protein